MRADRRSAPLEGRVSPMTIPETTHPLDVYDAAVLAGGLPRLVDTALVAMVESGRIRVEPSGEFRADATSSAHPVEAALLNAVGTRGHRSVDTIRWQVLHDARLDQQFQHLTADGLVRRALPSRLVGKTHTHTTAAGRRALQAFGERPSTGGGAVEVALHGRAAMPDQRLRAEIFQPRETVPVPRTPRRDYRRANHADAGGALHRAGGIGAAGGVGMLGYSQGFAGDGTIGGYAGPGADGGGGGGGGGDGG